MRTYRFKLYPTGIQQRKLFDNLNTCRFLYNKLLETKYKLDDQADIQLSKYDMSKYLTWMKKQTEYSFLKNYYSKMLQPVIDRLSSNLKGLSATKSKGRKVGMLRFKGKHRFSSFVYNQSGFNIIDTNKRYNKLHLSKIGDIRFRQHRGITGTIKQVQVKLKPSGWYAYIVTNGKYECKNIHDNDVGIDLGVKNYLADQHGDTVKNPLYLKSQLPRLQKAYVTFSKTIKGSHNRRKAILRLKRIFEKIDNQKHDFFHKVTTDLVINNKSIYMEDLNIKSMVKKTTKNKHFNMRNILDSSWEMFTRMLQMKVLSTTSELVFVNPANTSKKCSRCGNIQDMPLMKRIYNCDCGINLDRDHNAAINIFNQGKGLAFAEGFVRNPMKQEAPLSLVE